MATLSGDKVHRILVKRLPSDLIIGRNATYNLMRIHGLIRHKRCYHVQKTLTVYRLKYHGTLICQIGYLTLNPASSQAFAKPHS